MLSRIKQLFGITKKVALVLAVFYIILTVFSSVLSTHKPSINEEEILMVQRKKLYKILNNKELTSTRIGTVSLAIYRFSYCNLIGELCTDTPQEGNSSFNNSLLGKMSNLIALPYKYPMSSGTYWIASSLKNAGLVPTSYAAEGVGFASLKPIMNLWIIFRDVAYLIIVLILVTIGFLIMFRMKINAQTVISVENSLPKIVVTLLLITFSFAIAGLLVDLMYILTLLSINLLSFGDKYYSTAQVQKDFLGGDLGILWEYVLPYKSGAAFKIGNTPIVIDSVPFAREIYLGDALASIIPYQINSVIRGLALIAIPIIGVMQFSRVTEATGAKNFLDNISILGNGVGSIPQFILGTLLTILMYTVLLGITLNGFGFFVGIIVFLTIIALFFRLFFMLLQSYIKIIISIIFSPIILLVEAVPGKSTFSYWLKNLIGELITFPTIVTLLLTGKVMIYTLSYPGDFWKAPFLGGLNTEGFGVIFGAGLIFIIPDIVKFVKESLGVKPLPFNIGLGTYLGGAGIIGGSGMGILSQFSTLSMGISGIQNLSKMGKGVAMGMSAADAEKEARNRIAIEKATAKLKGGETELKPN